MTAIPDDKLFAHADRVRDKVVVITGAANGIGKETATQFAKYGAKVVIGDRDVPGAARTVDNITKAGGQAVSIKCDVTVWDNVVDMFEFAIAKYGAVDIVIPNAGIAEIGAFDRVQFVKGRPVPPDLATIQVNLIGVLYTMHLALHYLPLNRTPGSLKAVVLIGSMASWSGIPKAALYTASKHAVLGLMRSFFPIFEVQDIRISCIHPFFVDTGILDTPIRVILAGIPFTTVARVAGAVFFSATDPNPESNGSTWLLPDNGPVFHVPREEFKLGVYKMVDDRVNSLTKGLTGIVYYGRLVGDLARALGKPLFVLGLGTAVARLVWQNRELIGAQFARLRAT